MFDVKLLDRMNFGDLGKTLDYILQELERLAGDGSPDEDDPRHDMLLVIANQVIERMDSIIRDNGLENPELLDLWKRQTEEYRAGFKDYVNTYLKDGVPLLQVEPENSEQARAAAWQAEIDKIVLDEQLLEGMNAGDLIQMNKFIIEQVEKLDQEYPEDLAEPLIKKLLSFNTLVFRRLDPLVRERYRDEPEQLAGWLEIVNDFKDLDDEGEGDAGADVKSSAVS